MTAVLNLDIHGPTAADSIPSSCHDTVFGSDGDDRIFLHSGDDFAVGGDGYCRLAVILTGC